MFVRIDAGSRDEVFLSLSQRKSKGVYFLRLFEFSDSLEQFIWRYHEEARQRGVIIEEQINNPDDRQLSYYKDVMGIAFQPTESFVLSALQKWMPRMSANNRAEFAAAMSRQFEEMKTAGKNENIQKNVYIKMMCWLYYRFERLMPLLADDHKPKVLYEGNRITNHELIFLRMLSSMGTDILLLETKGDDAYLRLDPKSMWSQKIMENGTGPFPPDYSLKKLRKEMAQKATSKTKTPDTQTRRQTDQRTQTNQRVNTLNTSNNGRVQQQLPGSISQHSKLDVENRYPAPKKEACTNAWMKKPEMTEILFPPDARGEDHNFFYNAFIRIRGVKDKLTYENELYQFYQNLITNNRKVLVIDGQIPIPEQEELQQIRRRNYKSPEELIIDMSGNLPAAAKVELQRSFQRAFVRTMLEAAKTETNLNKLKNIAAYILCWIKRYQTHLFQGWKETDISCLIKMGACETAAEAFYVQLVSQLPADVLILAPDLNHICMVKSDKLLEIQDKESLPVMKFPKQNTNVQILTTAAHAERELTDLIYSDSGIYRNKQFTQAETITLQTTYDEIFILWDTELKYRPSFSTGDHIANIPVIYAKISGIEGGKIIPYWQKIKKLADTGETLFEKKMPIIQPGESNRFQALAVKGIKNRKIKRGVIKADRNYPFGLLREEMQEHIFNKLQQILDQQIVKGTFLNGTEYTILATVLNMKKELVRLIQNFDFTKKNPKIIAINTLDQSPSLEDAIMLTFLNKLGFDIVIFVPTGYQTIERYLNDNFPVEHQIGEYVYDLSVPDFNTLPSEKGRKWLNIFK